MGGSLRMKGEGSQPKCEDLLYGRIDSGRKPKSSTSVAVVSKPAGAGYAAARLEAGVGKGESSSRPATPVSPPPQASGSKTHTVAKTATELKHEEVKRKRVRQLGALFAVLVSLERCRAKAGVAT